MALGRLRGPGLAPCELCPAGSDQPVGAGTIAHVRTCRPAVPGPASSFPETSRRKEVGLSVGPSGR